MTRRLTRLLYYFGFSLPMVFLVAGVAAQTAEPITSLPKPPASASPSVLNGAGEAQQPTYQPSAPGDNSVHPITSLPKPQPSTPEQSNYPVPPTTVTPTHDAQPTGERSPQPLSPGPGSPTKTSTSTTVPGVHSYPTPSKADAGTTPNPPTVQPIPAIDSPVVATIPPQAGQTPTVHENRVHAFSTFGIQFKLGLQGIGFDVATPLSKHLNVRGGGSIFTYSGSYNDSGDVISGAAQFRSGSLYLDYFPFHGGFRISPGVFFNGSYLNGTTLVAPGTEFDLNGATYYSSATDPVHGTVSFNLGHEIAPSFTLGFGNIIPRSSKHLSFPFEVGFAYIGAPTIKLTLMGTVCDASTPPNCQKIDNDPSAQANLQQEVNNINSDIRFLRFYPILSQGISIKF